MRRWLANTTAKSLPQRSGPLRYHCNLEGDGLVCIINGLPRGKVVARMPSHGRESEGVGAIIMIIIKKG